ncbi:MAG: metallophosphoesterase [Verrucomicrobia subdivision 3 bacterium]|nr:metallophosphoesterase [Limisphaerales bacterium]
MSTEQPKQTHVMNRRQFVSAGAVAAALAPVIIRRSRAAESDARAFRFVFMPCIHLRRDLRSPEGFTAALRAIRKLSPGPDFILTGGDMCHNMRDQTIEQSAEIADLFLKIYKENCPLRVYHCLGNHDLAAWNKVAEAANDPLYGKQLTLQRFRMRNRYYGFDHRGWHFAVLDYLRISEPGKFTAEIDPEQMEWLRDDLSKNKGRPAMVLTHAPVISAVELFSDRAKRTEEALTVPFGRVISNAPALVETAKHGNVRAFISGHLHLVERLELMGHTFICSGSVSGHQWTGPRMGTPEGFGIFDCQPDGTFAFRYEPYGWNSAQG